MSESTDPMAHGEQPQVRMDQTTAIPTIGAAAEVMEGDHGLTSADVAAIDALPEGCALLIVRKGPNAGARFLLDDDQVSVGRLPENEIFFDDITVSRRHSAFVRSGDGFLLRDLGSLNGTYIGRDRIDEQMLVNGDELQIGKFRITYHQRPTE